MQSNAFKAFRLGVRRVSRLGRGCATALLLAGVFSAPSQAEEPKPKDADSKPKAAEREPIVPKPAQIEKWIAELSHDSFTVRQAATSRLLAAGIAARDPLQAAADSPDPETRAAAKRLVSLIDQSEFQRKLDAFAADTDGRRGLTLPGWERFREMIGGDAATRALFVEMQKHEAPLLAAAFGSSGQPTEPLWEERLARLVSWSPALTGRGNTPPLGSCAALLFLGSIDEMDISDRGAIMLENLVQRPPVREAIQPGTGDAAMRKLVAGWILHCPNKNDMIIARRLGVASMIDLKEVLPLALAVAGGDPEFLRAQPYALATAALVVGQFGSREDVDKLERLLDDATVCVRLPGAQERSVQVRDVALVVMLHLTGQKPAEYGYNHVRMQQPQRIFQLQTLHLDNDEQRTAAIAKWKAWRAEEGQGSRVKSREPEE